MDLLTLLSARRIEYRTGSARGELNLCCPFCEERGEPTPDTKFRLGLNYLRNEGHCFRCDWRTRKDAVVEVARALLGSVNEDIEVIVDGRSSEPKKEEAVELPEDFTPLTELDREEDQLMYRAYKFMRKRGVPRKIMRQKQLGVSMTGRYAYRVIFPVYWRGKLRGIVARDFTGNAKAKYLNSYGTKFLYNMPSRTDRVVLAEGAFKALAIEMATQEPAAALLGHALTTAMLRQLTKAKCKELVIWSDPDRIGIRGAVGVAKELMQSFKVEFIYPLPEKQADEYEPAEIKKMYKNRVPFTWGLGQKIEAALAFRS